MYDFESVVFTNYRDTKELMFHARLENDEEFDDQFQTIGDMFEEA